MARQNAHFGGHQSYCLRAKCSLPLFNPYTALVPTMAHSMIHLARRASPSRPRMRKEELAINGPERPLDVKNDWWEAKIFNSGCSL